MPKRKNRSKRSLASLPKGLPVRGGGRDNNPFDSIASHRNKRAKFEVHNRNSSSNNKQTATTNPSALARALERRKQAIQQVYKASQKANVFLDKRIGEYNHNMSEQEQQLARLVKERSRRSKRRSKYSLNDDDNDDDDNNDKHVLTHRGKAVDQLTAKDHAVLLSDDEEVEDGIGQLDAADTALHFGGGRLVNLEDSMYGPSSSMPQNMSNMYAQRKTDLDDLILRRKMLKAERLQSKERQVETFEQMDESFAELAEQLQFRDKEAEIRDHLQRKREGKLSKEDQEYADWDKEMKQYLYVDRKVKAVDRTKTPEEIAKEEADRLHELETRRLARMDGDFQDDDFSDISDDDENDDKNKSKKRKQKKKKASAKTAVTENPELLTDSDDDEDSNGGITTRFTADGLVKINRDGVVIGRVGEENGDAEKEISGGEQEDEVSAEKKRPEEQLASDLPEPLQVGARVNASYRATEQFDGNESWFTGVVSKVHNDNGTFSYDVEYDDGDFEENVQPCHVRIIKRTRDELEMEEEKKAKEVVLKRKKLKAKEKARSAIPYVFEVPTTLDALHDIIGNYASTGEEASLIVERIHKANSVRLDKRNLEKMQNFYDVLIRRFIAIGDAVHESGNGGPELGRYKQLDSLTRTMYAMAQDAPDSASAVWSRRLGFFQNAHAKRLRDAEFVAGDGENFTAWPSTGVVLALRSLGHIFPVTDLRHQVVTPALLLLGQMIGHTPVNSIHDLVIGLTCAGLLIEYTKEAKRVAPEAHGFLAGTIRLFAPKESERCGQHPLPNLSMAAGLDEFSNLRDKASQYDGKEKPMISLEKMSIANDELPAALLFAALHLSELSAKNLAGCVKSAEKEAFSEITYSILALDPKDKHNPLPQVLRSKAFSVVSILSAILQQDARVPIQRRLGPSTREQAIKSLAPRLENPDKYSLSKDKGKNATQAAADRIRREYKREHKAVSRELRMDAAMMETERRNEQNKKNSAAKAKRQKAFAWLEGEQATLNQQVRQGGGLLQGGGMGAAKAKAATAKLGIKKGGKF